MPNLLTFPKLSKSWLTGWPLVLILGVGLAVVALAYGSATDNLDNSCTMTVQVAKVDVRDNPGTTGAPVQTLTKGTQVTAEQIVDGKYRKLTGGDRWVPSSAVAATAGSRC